MPSTTDDLVHLIRASDFGALRDELGQRAPQELAAFLCEWRADDRVLAFRILPRRQAAAVFEYMTPRCQQSLVKTMAQEDVSGLLNHMSPDDRTLFLSEL